MRKEIRFGNADVGIGRNKVLFRAADVGTPLQQRRRQSGGNLRHVRLFRHFQAAHNRAGVLTEKNTNVILRLLDQLVQADGLCFCRLQQDLCLIHLHDGGLAALELHVVELKNLSIGCNCFVGVLQLGIVGAQQEVVGGDLGNQCRTDHVLAVFGEPASDALAASVARRNWPQKSTM